MRSRPFSRRFAALLLRGGGIAVCAVDRGGLLVERIGRA